MLWTNLKWRISVFTFNLLEAAVQLWQFWIQRRSWTRLSTTTSLTNTRLSTITKLSAITGLLTQSVQSLELLQPPVSQLSPVSSLASELPNEIFNMVLKQSVATNSCHNQKTVSPNQPVNFEYPERE